MPYYPTLTAINVVHSNIVLYRKKSGIPAIDGQVGDIMSGSPQKSLERVLSQLRAEHTEIRALLNLYAREPSMLVREHLLARICNTVRVHCSLEAGVVVPAVADALGDPQLLQRIGSAYAAVLGTINELSADHCMDERRQRLVTDLRRLVDAHIAAAESQEGFLTQAQRLSINWEEIERTLANQRSKFIYQS